MTTSANIAGTIKPFAVAGHGRRDWPYGNSKVYKIDEIVPKKKRKSSKLYYGQVGMLYVNTGGQVQEAYTEPVGKPKDNLWKIPSLGKVGHWRTVRGRRRFFPVDGSGPIPKIPGGKKGKSGILSKIAGLFGKKKKKKADSFSKDVSVSDTLKKIDGVLSKAKGAKGGGKQMVGPLKKMKAALANGDDKAFKKAEASLSAATKKLAKKKGR